MWVFNVQSFKFAVSENFHDEVSGEGGMEKEPHVLAWSVWNQSH